MKHTNRVQLQKQGILERLANLKPSKWKLERAIWRAGELRIKEAAPLLINLIGTDAPLRDYCTAWALGLCGSTQSVPTLLDLYNSDAPEFVKQITFEALLKLTDTETITNLKLEIINNLPQQTQIIARTTSVDIFTQFSLEHPYYFFAAFDQLYQLDNQYVRPALLNILRAAPFEPNYFRPIRRIFKIAEYRCDAEVFAILAYRFERTLGNFDNTLPANEWNEEQGKYLANKRRVYSDELQQDEPSFVYSYQTQQYLRRRVWRTLKALGEIGGADYIKMATAVLLEYSDTDTPPVIRSSFDKWDYYQREVKHFWDAYADYLTFNHILYTNSYRYKFNSKSWRRRKGVSVIAEPDVREEAFPELWQQHPEVLLKLLMNSKSRPVRHFAVNVLRDCQSFCASLDISTIITLVCSYHYEIAVFGIELALESLNPNQLNQELANALVYRIIQYTPTQKNFWIIEEHKFIQGNIKLIASLLTSPNSKTRSFVTKLISSYTISDATATLIQKYVTQQVIHKIFKLLALVPNQSQQANLIIEDLIVNFTPQLGQIDYNHLLMLLAHPIIEIQELGALIIINLYDKRILSKITVLYDIVHLISIERIYQWRNQKAIEIGKNLILSIVQNPSPKIRNVIKPIIRRLENHNPSLQVKLAFDLINILVNPKAKNDVRQFIMTILKENLQTWAKNLTKEYIYQLLQADYYSAKLGSLVLEVNSQNISNDFTTQEIIDLANSSLSSIRKAAQQLFLESLEKIRGQQQKILELISLLNSEWQDSRQFGFKIFTSELKIDELTPKVIITICNIDKEEAQMLGLNLLNLYLRSIQQQAIINPSIILETATQFILLLLPLTKHPRIYTRILRALQENFPDWTSRIHKDTVFQILQAKSPTVQEFAILTLNSYFHDLNQITTSEIITITNHDIIAVREIGRRLFSQKLDNCRNNIQEMLNAIPILESKWQDTREYGFKIFTTEFNTQEMTPSVLIRICDSTSKEVRKLGYNLLIRYNNGANLEEYLLKFSEHPSSDMQMFVTNYLDNAANNPQYLRALVPYFTTVLSSVNRNSGARKRIFSFLEKQAQKSEEAAMIITEIMKRQSATMVTADKATAIQIMLKIKKAYPHLEVPILVQDVIEERRKSIR